jgi:hypothetical protein
VKFIQACGTTRLRTANRISKYAPIEILALWSP